MAIPLGRGSETTEAISQAIARDELLEALHELLPEAICDLLTEDALAAITPGMMAPTPALWAHIERWQERYGLQEPWFGEMAFLTILEHASGGHNITPEFPWAAYPGGIDMAIHGDPGPIWHFASQVTLPGMTWEWIPTAETRTAARARILEELEQVLDVQLDAAVGEDAPRVPSKYAEHFRWLAMYQCRGMSKSKIAEAVDRDRTQVGRAITETAELVGITLRRAKGGRPKGAKTVRFSKRAKRTFYPQ